MYTTSQNIRKTLSFALGLLLGFLVSTPIQAALNISQNPLFLTQSAKPIVMLNISNDHQLYIKAYDDYSDLDHDGIPETTYKHSFDYYGYFDSYKCYNYSGGVFVPASITATKYCSGNWSGNFLNWAAMTRIDTIRKILYGGYRSTDTNSSTILERSYLPNDAHSIAKFYNGADLNQLTPHSPAEGITLCSTTITSTQYSQNVTDPPRILVARGDFSLWAAAERWQCRWREDKDAPNNNALATTGMNAANNAPRRDTHRLGGQDFIARVEVCKSGLVGTESCKDYNGSLKPIGLLQSYGDEDKIRFGLLTGSYSSNVSGGVLRKNVGSMADEINVDTDGTFKSAPASGGIINTLNRFRIYGYSHNDGTYFDGSGGDGCNFTVANLTNGSCSNWGNPQSEIYLESLRYLAGKSASPAFNANDSGRFSGLVTATWSDPIPSDEWCSKLNIIQFNASTNSYDADELAGASDIGITNLNTITNTIGDNEGVSGNNFFVGRNGTDNNDLCTSKAVNQLSSVRGTCPDAPRQEGSYQIAGLAHYAKNNSIRNDLEGEQKVNTYGVTLASGLPRILVPVPGNTEQKITILPACQNTRENNSCSIVDFKVIDQPSTAGGVTTGRVYINWETGEQGGDYDMDVQGILNYSVTATQATVTTNVFAASTGAAMGFGYIINGTTQDGYHAHSGHNNYNYTDPTGVLGCSSCVSTNNATSVTYNIGTATASNLELPLWYTAKWGGFNDANGNGLPDLQDEWDKDGDGIPDRYFFATNPSELAESLGNALADVIAASSSSAAVATNSTRLDTNTVVYQAKFNSVDWTGQLLAYTINPNGSIAENPTWDAGQRVTTQGAGGRSIFSYNPDITPPGISFLYDNLSAAQQAHLNEAQVNYLKGLQSQEQQNDGVFRNRTGPNALLGDLINSDPWFIGNINFGYYLLPGTEGSDYSNYRNSEAYKNRTPLLAIGSNGGMLHVFNANVTGTGNGNEVFAYVPHTLIPDLAQLTLPAYTAPNGHRYFVDGSPIAGDAYFDADNNGSKEWRTVLVGTLGAGGKGVFALDTTFLSPSDSTYETAEVNENDEPDFTGNRVLWEINSTTTGFSDLGFTLGQASIVRMANGEFAAVFGNGYNSTNHKAVLYIVNIKTGALIKSLDTVVGNAGNPNGLSTPIAIDVNGDRIVDAIYAGDLHGNLWKFDVSNSNPNNWDFGFKSGSMPSPLLVTKDAGGTVQSITAKPQAGLHPNGGVMIYFGTGKYFEVGDNSVVNPQMQTFYGVRDSCVKAAGATGNCNNNPVSGRADLQQQEIIVEGVFGNFDVRVTTKNVTDLTDYLSTKEGWYMDLAFPLDSQVGERVVSQALLRAGRIIFVTMIPEVGKCTFGGTSWLMELDALTGNRLDSTPFDISGDDNINLDDMVTLVDTNDDGLIDGDDEALSASGKKSKVGIIKSPGVVGAGEVEYKYTSGSDSNLEMTVESVEGGAGRQSWRQLR